MRDRFERCMFNKSMLALATLLLPVIVLTHNVQAKVLNVQCGTTTNPNSITAALRMLDPNGTNTLNISGACKENILIQGFNRLTLIGRQDASVVDASNGASQTILVVDSSDVFFRQLTIMGGVVGVQCDDFSICRFAGDTVLGGQAGIQITESRAQIGETTVRNTDNGITSLGGSSVRIIGGVMLDNNQTGLVVDSGSTMEVISATITSPRTGIYVSGHGYLSLSSSSITGGRNGIEVVGHSDVQLLSGNTISGNSDFGLFLFDTSFASFDPGNNITGNNLNGISSDVACFQKYTTTRGALTNIGGGTTNCTEN